MNKQRERLVELFNQLEDPSSTCPYFGINKGCVRCKYRKEDGGCDLTGRYVDYLLANGVIVPPVKVGHTVYVIEPCTCLNNYSDFDKCHRRRTKATKWIEIVRVPKKHFTKCLKLFERPFKVEYLNKIGKTVFLTKEEALSKLQASYKQVKGGVQG